MTRCAWRIALTAALVAQFGMPSLAEEPARPWSDTAEFSVVRTTGNSETSNIAGSNKFVYRWSLAEFESNAAFLRTETTSRDFGTNPVTETEATTAESYVIDGKYRRTIRDGFFWYAAAGWNRNRFAGIDDEYVGGAGVGYRFFDDDEQSLVGELGASYTDQSRVGGIDESFAGARAFLEYQRKLSASAEFVSSLEILENLDQTEDLRANWLTSVSARLTSKLALKAGYTVRYDRQPVIVEIPGGTFEFDDVDTILTTSLVVNF